ncbi:cobalamin-5'-phosphate synthase [Scopulibacillus darangshiensis]|uniref:Adenosylcobinamide-GDP ribazoletransferase n=1 Tax=Scopulibacillus darangshiensis TaxID=442528 RepID=A0A4R2P8R4_9BACL|nr:adenosylcobinamide-GDP ribazoletransferase [Scopulibacillus darangshiensis]TCP31257.1 cobalamin-5'-phosphate synthase [Scopulibacillus darangshiensis]
MRKLRESVDGLLLALQFFTIFPVSKDIDLDNGRLRWCIRVYPLIGLGFGLILALVLWLMQGYTPFSSQIMALIILTLSIALTGGLHIDGWMDCSDAYFSFRDRNKRLEIMKDPHVGAFAVLSLLFMLAWRFLLIGETIYDVKLTDLALIILIPFLSRTVMGYVMIFTEPAKKNGLASFFKKAISARDSFFYLGYAIVLFILAMLCSQHLVFQVVVLMAAAVIFGLAAHRFISKQFGGITGDTLGATVEGGETWLWMILWLLHVFVTA